MAYVTYKGRTSSDYRFTCKSLDDPAITDLKAMLVEENNYIKRARKTGFTYFAQKPTRGLRIRPRGPRLSQWAKDTPWENATHYDVYVRNYS